MQYSIKIKTNNSNTECYIMIEIKKIKAENTFPVRHLVLRKGKPIESCQFEGDENATTTHFGLFLNQNLIGVVSIFQENHHYFEAKKMYQIRGMAVLENFQGKKYGEKLLEYAENYCFSENASLIWFNARASAVPFYENSNYTTIGAAFEIPKIGTHFVMYKQNTKFAS